MPTDPWERQRAMLEEISKSFAGAQQFQQLFAPAQEAMRQLTLGLPVLDSLSRIQDQVAAQIAAAVDLPAWTVDPALAESIARLLREARAPNWPEDRDDLDVVDLIRRTNWPLVWVPDEPLVCRLLDAGDEEDLELVLLGAADDVLASCSYRLGELPVEFSPGLAKAANQCVNAFPVAPMAAQALAAITFENLVLGPMGHAKLTAAATDLSDGAATLETVPYRLLRWSLICFCMPDALESFWPSKGDPVPRHFNRHASVHTLSDDQYTASNALIGIMLITAALRELHHVDSTAP